MKVRNLFFAVLASAAVLVGCQEKEQDLGGAKLEIAPESLEFESAAESKTIALTATRDWRAQNIPNWVVVEPSEGQASADPQTVTLSVKENKEYNLSGEITFTIGTLSKTLTVSQQGEKGDLQVETITIKEFIDKADTENEYTVHGTVSDFTNKDNYKAFVINDGTGDLTIFFPENFDEYADQIKNGGTAYVKGKYFYFEDKQIHQIKNGQILKYEEGEGGGDTGEIPENPTLTPIKDIFAKYTGTKVTLEAGTYIKGVVVSNNALNNQTSLMNMFIQDADGGIQVRFSYDSPVITTNEAGKKTHPYSFGDELIMDLSGAELSAYNGAVQINNHAGAVKKTASATTVEPRQAAIADVIANKYYGQYVQIKEAVQVVDADLQKKWNMSDSHTSIVIETEAGVKTEVFTAKYSTVLAKDVAQGSGLIKGLATGAGSAADGSDYTANLMFAQETDADALTGARFASAPFLDVEKREISVAADAVEASISVMSNVAWTATASAGATLENASGENNGTIKVSFAANEDTENAKTYTVTLKANGCGDVVVTITQAKKTTAPEPGETVTVTKKISEISGATENGTKVTEMILDDVVTIKSAENGNNGKVYANGAEWRFYQTENGTMTVAVKTGHTLVSVKVTYDNKNNGILLRDAIEVKSDTIDNVSGESVVYSVGSMESDTKNAQVRVTAIEVVYK